MYQLKDLFEGYKPWSMSDGVADEEYEFMMDM